MSSMAGADARRCAGVLFKRGELLWMPVFGDFKVFLVQARDRLSVLVGDQNIYNDRTRTYLEDRSGSLR